MGFSTFREIDDYADRGIFGPSRQPAVVAPTRYAGPDGSDIWLPTFEFGLVLAGAVSAGAYSAGVLDYLIEVLDGWEEAKIANALEHGDDFAKWSVPPHAVRLTAVAGASAGSVCSSILAVTGTGKFPSGADLTPDVVPPRPSYPRPPHPNPLYDVWVRRLDIVPMLDTADLRIKGLTLAQVESLLNTQPLDDAAAHIVQLKLPAGPRRPWLEKGLEFGFTIGNLTGVPYRYQLLGLDGADFGTTRHADMYTFSVAGHGQPPELMPPGCADGGPFARRMAGMVHLDWKEVANAALASAAFPVALKPRKLTKEVHLYDKLPILSSRYLDQMGPTPYPKDPHTGIPPVERWSQGANVVAGTVNTTLAKEVLPFTAVDGGTMNNQPFEFVRRAVAGPMGNNERDGSKANRAVMLIDPFPAPKESDVSASSANAEAEAATSDSSDMLPVGVLDVIPRLLAAYKNQARYDANDLTLAADPNVYSRFMLSPLRAAADGSTLTGGDALASGGMAAFAGFLSESYRHHDFLLGRRNAEYFLRTYFSLPETNPLFDKEYWGKLGTAKNPTGPYWTMISNPDGLHERQIIPVLIPASEPAGRHEPAVGVTDPMQRLAEARKRLMCRHPIWPGSAQGLDELMEGLNDPIRGRVDALVDLVIKLIPSKIGEWFVGVFAGGLKKSAVKKLTGKIEAELRASGLGAPAQLPPEARN
ncbi:patatin-like phospholipase family protein [Sandaracinobacteroides hominis]|uniref:patatin-like phospholipase family protein n=1 Tax=Sandaracinobacteroides hominis TaxID=2780086 RepID=UPI0018F4A931|nr:patatin-like phospholipase family protein [Sandaracinobacteroides hominis]